MDNEKNILIKPILDEIRKQMIGKTIYVFSIMCSCAIVVSLLRIFTIGFQTNMAVQLFSIGIVWFLVVMKNKMGANFRAFIFLTFLFLTALSTYISLGGGAGGPQMMIVFVVLSSQIFGLRGGVISFIVAQLMLILLGFAFVNEWLVVKADLNAYNKSSVAWILRNVIFATYVSATVAIIYIYYKALVDALLISVTSKKEVETYKEHLEDIVNTRTEELRFSESRLLKALDKAESANRAKSTFLANMSHEIRTPLNAVIGFSELLQSKLADVSLKSYVDSIKTSGQALLSLINDILDLSKIEAGKIEMFPSPVSVENLLEQMSSIFSFKVQQKKLNFEVSIEPGFPEYILIDELRIRQILMNLIGNSVKYTEKGFVKVSVSSHNINESSIILRIVIEDSGMGIKKEFQSVIFDAFQQQSLPESIKYEGTGLGLSITRKIIEVMSGDISLESEFGKGTKMTLLIPNIPISAVGKKSLRVGDVDIATVNFNPAKLLVVDDIETNRHLIMKIFADSSMEVIEAHNGVAALDQVELNKPDLILMDIRMPVMDGVEAARRLKANPKTKDIPIVALTASVLRGEENEEELKIFDGFLRKPVRIAEIYAEMMRFLTYSKIETPEISEDKLLQLDITEQQKAKANEIIELLEQKLLPKWESLQGKQSLQQIEAFSKLVVNEAEHFGLTFLQDYSQNLWESIQNFDVEQKDRLFADFPNVLKRLIEQLKK